MREYKGQPVSGTVPPGAIRSEFEWNETNPAAAIVRSVAAVSNMEPADLPPLYDITDPDALDRILTHDSPAEEDGLVHMSFLYAGCDVTIDQRGTVMVEPLSTKE